MEEQEKRHAQHNNTESNLEPDIKNAPGGIRDMNQIGWIAKRHFASTAFMIWFILALFPNLN
jgi:[protein-PII] uridylyltransferase